MKIIFFLLINILLLRKLMDFNLNPKYENAIMNVKNYNVKKFFINNHSQKKIKFNYNINKKYKYFTNDIKYNYHNDDNYKDNNVNTDFYLWLNNLSGMEYN